MANEERTGKSNAELEQQAWKIAGDTRVAILFTTDGERQSARPMSVWVCPDENAICFLTAADSQKVQATGHNETVTVFFARESANEYVSFTGIASVSNDRERIRKLWTPFAKAWWDSAEDPSIRLLTVHPTQAEIWDGPNKLVAGTLLLGAAITGSKPRLGDHAKLRM